MAPQPERQFPGTRRLGGRGAATRALLAATQENLPLHAFTGELETVSEEPKSEQHEPGGAGGLEGAFALERVEHETGGGFGLEGATSEELESEKAFVPESKADESGGDSSADESETELNQDGQSGAHPGGTGRRTKTVRLVYQRHSTNHAESHETRTRRCLALGYDAGGGRQPFATGADHAPRSTDVPELAKLAARAKKRNGRSTRAPG